jgi:hypothetical protein
VSEAQGGQRRNAAHYHCIVHLKRAGFGAQLPRSWRTADQEQYAVELRPAERQKKTDRPKKRPREQKSHGLANNVKNRKKPEMSFKSFCPGSNDSNQTLDLFGDVK